MMSNLKGQTLKRLMSSRCLLQVGEGLTHQDGSGADEFMKEEQIRGRLKGHLW
jgi:hypothetical protein